MHATLQNFLSSPALHDDDEAFRTALLGSLLVAGGVILTFAAVILTLTGLLARGITITAGLGTAVLLLLLQIPLRRGYLREVTLAVVAILLIGCSLLPLSLGTLQSVILAYYLIPVMIATFLIGPRGGLVVLGLSVATVFSLAVAQGAGLLPSVPRITPLNQWSNLSFLLMCGFAFLVLIRRGFLTLVERLHTELAARRAAEAALTELTATLEARVRERTAALSVANAELTRATRLKDEFLASMSHELRTPLNAVLGVTEALGEGLYGPVSDRQRTALARVEQGGHRLLKQINDILDMSQLSVNTAPLTLTSFPVGRVCGACLASITPEAAKRLIHVQYTPDLHAGTIVADERRISQILDILLSNAVKFTESGGSIGLDVHSDHARDVLELSVWDTGIGIAAANFDRLFRPFVQVDGALARRYEGSGLGLALVARLVELHCGSVIIESTEGSGTRITVRLPLRDAAPRAEVATGAEHPVSVLVVENSARSAARTRDALLAQGHRVEVASTLADALTHARSEPPDAIIMGIHIPGLAGPEMLRQIVEATSIPRPRLIAVANIVLPGDRERWLEAGADAFLVQPAPLSELARLVVR